MKRFTLTFALLGLACGADDTPVNPTPQIVQVAGVWDYTARGTRVTGGTCVAASLGGVGGPFIGTLQANQVGSAVNAALSVPIAPVLGGPQTPCPMREPPTRRRFL